MLGQRGRRWADAVQILYKCFVLTALLHHNVSFTIIFIIIQDVSYTDYRVSTPGKTTKQDKPAASTANGVLHIPAESLTMKEKITSREKCEVWKGKQDHSELLPCLYYMYYGNTINIFKYI